MSSEIRSNPYWGCYGDPFVAVSVMAGGSCIGERFEHPTEGEMKLLPPKREWLIIDDTNAYLYVARHKADPKSLTEEEKSALSAHLLVETIIELDIIIRERKAREDRWREERNKLSKEIPKMSGKEKEKAINRVKELKAWMQSSSAVGKGPESEK
jgi:hypothetical protein